MAVPKLLTKEEKEKLVKIAFLLKGGVR